MIFSRRSIQKAINENLKFLTTKQSQKHVDELNDFDEESLAFEWEIVLLNALSKIGSITHEPILSGSSRPDILFSNTGLDFIADVTTISDKGYEKENPKDYLVCEINKCIRKYNLKTDNFSMLFGDESIGVYKNKKINLKIPKKGSSKEFIDKYFESYLQSIKQNQDNECSHKKKTNALDITITYTPNQRYQFVTHTSFNTAYSLKKNPIYNSLKSKAKQLKKSDYDGIKVIFLCDGACGNLQEADSNYNYSKSDIIKNFLRDNSSISAVMTFNVERPYNSMISFSNPEVKYSIYANANLSEPIVKELNYHLSGLIEFLPKPIKNAISARAWINNEKINKIKYYGGWMPENNKIKLSSRDLLNLLSGSLNSEEFLKKHEWFSCNRGNQQLTNLFKLRLEEGRLFSNVTIEKSSDKDDDWITFEFGDPDPAITKFKLPIKNSL